MSKIYLPLISKNAITTDETTTVVVYDNRSTEGEMRDPCLICGRNMDGLGQCDRHSEDGLLRRLEQFDPQPIEPGYLGEDIAATMDDAAALIRFQSKKIAELSRR